MTDDIVTRLREYCDGNNDLMDAAADRIEQLETALQKIACVGAPYDKCHCVNSDECSYGIARAALKEGKTNG